jgi:hypothetical protein
MAIGKASDFKIYEEEFWGGMSEALEQQTEVFNAASRGAFKLIALALKGNYRKESFLLAISSLISRRDTTSVAAATDLAPTQDELISVKVARKIGPVANTLDAWRKIGADPQSLSFILGKQIGKAVAAEYVNAAIRAVVAGLSGQAALIYDGSAETISHTALVEGLAKLGDASSNVVCWVMYGKVAHDLMKQSIADKVDLVAGATILTGSIASLNRPIIITDSSPMDLGGTPKIYATLGLQEGAVEITESEARQIAFELVTGLENLVYRLQGEYAFNVGLRGMKYNIAGGGANPNDSALGTSSNWTKAATDNKSLPGVLIKSK